MKRHIFSNNDRQAIARANWECQRKAKKRKSKDAVAAALNPAWNGEPPDWSH
jgi:hypothetical protein